MLLLHKPTDARVERLLAEQATLPLTYAEVGASRAGAPPGYTINHFRGHLGMGAATYSRAIAAMRGWRTHDLGWFSHTRPDTPIVAGAVFGGLARSYGLWSLNVCRIVYVVDEDGAVCRWGYGVGTLPAHLVRGEERFTVEWRRDDDSVWYEIFAFSRLRHPLVRIGGPLARMTQRRFAVDSYQAIRTAISCSTGLPQ